VRRFPTRFLVKREHVAREGERIVEQNDGYVIVEKYGDAAVTAIQHDPRRASRGDRQVQR
jgi:predicted methyltransferase